MIYTAGTPEARLEARLEAKMLQKLKDRWKKLKRWQKGVAIGVGVAAGIPLVFTLYMTAMYPDYREADPGLDVDRTPPAITRGEYLYHAVADCSGCHTRRDFRRFGGPQVADVGAGFGDHEHGGLRLPFAGLPGEIYPSNITMDRETGLGKWTDDEMIRAIRDGVSRDESTLFPLMPYGAYARMSDTDVQAIVAYMRHLPSIPRAVPNSSVRFPVNMFVRMAPRPVTEVVPDINRQDRVKYGEYLATLAGCIGCHTMGDGPDMRTDMLLAGGHAYSLEGWDYEVVSANLTPHATGMTMTEQQFVDRFKSYLEMANGDAEIPLLTRDNATPMPWFAFSTLSDGDLRMIYAYLRSVPAIANTVTKRRPLE